MDLGARQLTGASPVSQKYSTQFERFFDLSVDMLAIASTRDGRWKRVNPAFERFLGWPREELLAIPYMDLVHPEDKLRSEVAMANLAAGEPLLEFEHRVLCKDGSYKWIAWHTAPYPAEELIYCVGRDITAHVAAEQAHRESEQRLRLAAEAAGFGTYDYDPRRKEAIWSDQLCAMVGFNGEMPITLKQAAPYIHPEDLDHFHRNVEEATPPYGSGDHTWVYRMITANGKVLWMRDVGRTYFEGEGDERYAVRVIGTVQDITERKHAEDALRASEERRRSSSEVALVGTFEWNISNDVNTWSPELEVLHGLPEGSFGGTYADWTACVHPDDLHEAETCVQEAMESGELHAQWRVVWPDGSLHHLEARARVENDAEGKPFRMFGANFEVTERVEAEQALARARDELEARVLERTAELQQRAQQLARLTSELTLTEQRERQRLAQILHDHLQQLLVGAKLRLELLSRNATAKQVSRVKETMDLVQDAITASRSLTVELAPPILQEAGLASGLDWLARWMQERHGLTVSLTGDNRIVTQNEDVRVLLFQSVRELLFNIVKHAGVHEAAVDLSEIDCEHVQIIVSDDGRGFDVDTALAADTREGAGFGLFSIQERISLLGGSFQVESAPGRGARFTIVAPTRGGLARQPVIRGDRAHETDAIASLPNKPREANQPIRVLVVDDHNVMRDGLTMLLTSEPDIEVISEAADGVAAVQQARLLQPDVILMDYSMPEMDGVEATRRIKAELPYIEIIGLSMYAENDRAAAMIDAGASSYHTKSGNTDEIIDAIRAVRARFESSGK